MAALQAPTHHQRQAPRTGLRLLGFCLFVVLTLAACGSDGDTEETSAGSGTDDTTEAADNAETESTDANATDSDSGDSDSTESESTESTTTAPTEGSTTSVEDTTSPTTATTAPDTTVSEDSSSTIDKADALVDPDETKPTVAPPTTVAGSGGDPLVDQVIGMSEAAAIDLIRSNGRKVRVERRDGEEFMLTQDFEPDRLNLTVANGSVISVRLG